MRMVIAFVVPLLLLAACGGNEEEIAAKKQTLRTLRAQDKELNKQYVEQSKKWGPIKAALIPAQREYERAQASGDADATAAAKAALDQAKARYNDVLAQEDALKRRQQEMRDKIGRLEDQIRRLGGRP